MVKRVVPLFILTLILLSLSLALTTTTSVNAQSATGSWNATFYNTTNFTGTPVFSRIYTATEMASLTFSPSPAGSVQADNFSAIFTSSQFLQAGNYTISVYADDQAELRINGQLIIDINVPGSQVNTYTVPVSANYSMEIRYVELTSSAAIQVRIDSATVGGATLTLVPTVPPTRTPLPAIPPGALTATVIRASVLNVRNAPSLGGLVMGRILRGETYAVVGRDADARWFLLQLGGYQGWSYGYYLFINGNEFNPPIVSGASLLGLAGQQDYGVRGQSFATLRLREGPSVATRQIGRVTWGAFLPIIGRTSGAVWYQTVWKGTVGWVYSPFVKIVEGDLNNVPIK